MHEPPAPDFLLTLRKSLPWAQEPNTLTLASPTCPLMPTQLQKRTWIVFFVLPPRMEEAKLSDGLQPRVPFQNVFLSSSVPWCLRTVLAQKHAAPSLLPSCWQIPCAQCRAQDSPCLPRLGSEASVTQVYQSDSPFRIEVPEEDTKGSGLQGRRIERKAL
jgi:hypothetical protein